MSPLLVSFSSTEQLTSKSEDIGLSILVHKIRIKKKASTVEAYEPGPKTNSSYLENETGKGESY